MLTGRDYYGTLPSEMLIFSPAPADSIDNRAAVPEGYSIHEKSLFGVMYGVQFCEVHQVEGTIISVDPRASSYVKLKDPVGEPADIETGVPETSDGWGLER